MQLYDSKRSRNQRNESVGKLWRSFYSPLLVFRFNIPTSSSLLCCRRFVLPNRRNVKSNCFPHSGSSTRRIMLYIERSWGSRREDIVFLPAQSLRGEPSIWCMATLFICMLLVFCARCCINYFICDNECQIGSIRTKDAKALLIHHSRERNGSRWQNMAWEFCYS